MSWPVPGGGGLARAEQVALRSAQVGLDADWGLGHGAWSVLR